LYLPILISPAYFKVKSRARENRKEFQKGSLSPFLENGVLFGPFSVKLTQALPLKWLYRKY